MVGMFTSLAGRDIALVGRGVAIWKGLDDGFEIPSPLGKGVELGRCVASHIDVVIGRDDTPIGDVEDG